MDSLKVLEVKKEYFKQYRLKNKDKINEYQRKYRSVNKDKVKEYNKKYWIKKANQIQAS